MDSFILFHVKHINSCHFKPEHVYVELIDLPVEFVRFQRHCKLSESNTNRDSLMAIRSQSLTMIICCLHPSCRQLYHSADIQEDIHRCMFIISKFTGSRTYVCRVARSTCRVGDSCLHLVPNLFIFRERRSYFFCWMLFICYCHHCERQVPLSSFAAKKQMSIQESEHSIGSHKKRCYLGQQDTCNISKLLQLISYAQGERVSVEDSPTSKQHNQFDCLVQLQLYLRRDTFICRFRRAFLGNMR